MSCVVVHYIYRKVWLKYLSVLENCGSCIWSSATVMISSVLISDIFWRFQLDFIFEIINLTGPREEAQWFVLLLSVWARARQGSARTGPGLQGGLCWDWPPEVPVACTCSFSPLSWSPDLLLLSSPPSLSHPTRTAVPTWKRGEMSAGGVPAAGCSYQKFVHFAMEQTRLRTPLVPHASQVLFIPSRYAPAMRVN
jgi:hypothetical protein